MSEPVKKGQRYQNRESFKAHRNIKRAVRDVDAEAALKQQACAGVCRRCAQKVVWKFHYEKYRAMRKGKTGNCTRCKLKRVHLSYRMLCDPCARESKMCPGCNHPASEQELREGDGADENQEDSEEEYSSGDDMVDDEKTIAAARARRAEALAAKQQTEGLNVQP